MSNLTCSRSCLMKRDLECSVDKLSFMKENWPSFAQIENVDRLSKAELQCSLCLLDIVIDGHYLKMNSHVRIKNSSVWSSCMCIYRKGSIYVRLKNCILNW